LLKLEVQAYPDHMTWFRSCVQLQCLATLAAGGLAKAVFVLSAIGCAIAWIDAHAQGIVQPRVSSQKASFSIEAVASGLEHPWGLAFLPDGRFLVTERPGRIRIVAADGSLSQPLSGLPRLVAREQGGLLDVVLDPNFSSNRIVYFSFSEPRGENRNATSVARASLNEAGTALLSTTIIFRQEPAYAGGHHFGSRLVFDREGYLFVTLGERLVLRDEAQNPANHLGKILRITREGQPAPGNPVKPGWLPEIWSIGHRNVQGAALDPSTGRLWTAEHGARGGDEVNSPEAGKNYGWPVITYGRDYSGRSIGEGTQKEGMEQPLFYWDPSIAPSGLAIYTGDAFPGWRNSVFIGALAGQMLVRLERESGRIAAEERLLVDLNERIRDVRQGPDGLIYLLTDSQQGRILRLRPVKPAQ
jgi:aldose sugar dehydrogenase